MHAILGMSSVCIAVNRPDMNVALAVLNAIVQLRGPKAAEHPDRRLPPSAGQYAANRQGLLPAKLIMSAGLPPPIFPRHAPT